MSNLSDMSDILVVYLRNGIGDTVLFRPYYHALAQRAHNKKIALVTPYNKGVDSQGFLKEDPCIQHIFFQNKEDLLSVCRFYHTLRPYKFKEVWLFQRSLSQAIGCWIAGIPNRYGFGFKKKQRRFLTHWIPNHRDSLYTDNYSGWPAQQLLESQGVPMPENAGRIPVSKANRKIISERFQDVKKPWIGLGIGASYIKRQWTAEKFAALIDQMDPQFQGTFFLWGGRADAALAKAIAERSSISNIQTVTDLSIQQSVAFMETIDLFIGNDSALLNIAAACGKPAVGLFGVKPPLVHSPHFIPVSPPHYVYGDEEMSEIHPCHVIAVLNESVRIQKICL